MPNGADLRALCRLISDAELLLTATSLPKAYAERAAKVLRSAWTMAEVRLETPPIAAKVRISGVRTAGPGPTQNRQIAGNGKIPVPSRPPDLRASVTEMRRLVHRVSRELAKLAAQKGA